MFCNQINEPKHFLTFIKLIDKDIELHFDVVLNMHTCFVQVDKINAIRIPINQECAPAEECFDQILAALKNTTASTPIVFNCQAGISRTTTGMVIASLVKEFQLASELNHMKGIVPDDILEALKKKKLGLPGIDIEAPVEKNAMMAGEFEVIMELLAAYGEGDQAKIAKAQVSNR